MRTVAGRRSLPSTRRHYRGGRKYDPAMKWCPNCERELPRDEEHFRRYKSGWQGYCRSCTAPTHKKYAGRHVMEVRALKDGQPCTDCGERFPFYCLDYDHRPGEVKKGEIARMASGTYTWETILAEIAKCDLICANCHRKRTWLRATGASGTAE